MSLPYAILSGSKSNIEQELRVPRLIINADDFGAGAETDRGILAAFQVGVVSSASLLTNGPGCAAAAAAALQTGLPLGIHLNLAEGFPLSGPLPGLTLADGRFPGKQRLRRVLHQQGLASADLRRELCAQIEQALRLGIKPDHLDSHQHFFLFPGPQEIILELAQKYSISALRLPAPAEPVGVDPIGPLGTEMKLYRRLAPEMIRAVQQTGLRTPAGLFGMPFLNRMDMAALETCLEHMPAGDCELMVHPGYPDQQNPFSGAERSRELDILLAKETKDLFKRHRITLMSFAEL